VRRVFDRLVATDEQIRESEQAAGLLPEFDATNEAIEQLQARSLRDLKWTENARNKTIKALQKEAATQRKGIEECPPGAVFVIDSRGDARAASAGGILVARLRARGVAGVVTDGGFRDSPEIGAMGWPAYHATPSAPTNLIHHHCVDLNVPVACAGVGVHPGDIMVGDGEGVVCIPAHIAEDVAAEAFEQTVFEDFVQERVAAGHTIRGLYPMTDPANRPIYEAWRKQHGR
jgi:regulator of RNase E activity RraA